MSQPVPSILLIGNAASRLDQVEGALERMRARFSEDELLGITIGYRGKDDILVFVLEAGPTPPSNLGEDAVAVADLRGMRALNVSSAGPPQSLAERALKTCNPVIPVRHAKEAVAELRTAFSRPETTARSLAKRVPIRFDDPQSFLEVYTRDLAAGTLFVSTTDAKPPIGATIALELFVPGDDSPIRALAKVIHHGDVAGPGYGTRVALSEVARDRLRVTADRLRESSSSKEIRNQPRVRARLGVTYSTGSDVARSWTQDISKGGVFVATSTPPPIGTQVDLELELPGGEKIQIAATVVRLVSKEQAQAWDREEGCGLAFQGISPEIQERLEAFVDAEELKPQARVLLVDDTALFRTMLADELATRGCEVLEASNGAAAFEILMDELFALDLLVLDLVLPNTSGTELLDRIRRLGGETELAIAVVATGVEDTGIQRRVTIAGADQVLPKSLPVAAIADRLMALIEERGAASPV